MRRCLIFLLTLTTPLAAQDGGQLYTLYCSACHAPDGKGATGGLFPPLAGSPWLAGDPDRAIKVILHGLHGPLELLGKSYDLEMPPQGAVLPDDQIAAILTHVRSSWGNKAAAVTTETVKTIRAATAERTTMWNAKELLKIHPLPLEKTALRNLISQVYRGNWKHIPNFSTLKPDSVEEEHDGIISIADSPHEDDFAMVWEAQLEVPADGKYGFSLDADDAAKILIDGEVILEIEGLGPMTGSRAQRSTIPLTQGVHPIRVEYLEHKGEQGISIGWKPAADKQYQWLTDTKDTAPKGRDPLPIGPADGRPVIYRNFIAGTSPRAIGVGFPGGLNLAYSADHLGPELLWNGEFMDGAAKWLDRGTATNPPAGESIVQLASSPAISDAKFKGYKLSPAGNPTFVSQIKPKGGFISDTWTPGSSQGNPTLARTLTLQAWSKSVKILLSDKEPLTPIGGGDYSFGPLILHIENGAITNEGNSSFVMLNSAKPVTLTYRWK